MKKMIILVHRDGRAFNYFSDAFVVKVKSGLTFKQYTDFAKLYAEDACAGYCDDDEVCFFIVDELALTL